MVKLDEYQKEVIERLKPGSILCGGVGSGKSRTALACYFLKGCKSNADFTVMKRPKDLYIITTAKKRDSKEWEKECSIFLLSKENSIHNVNLVIDSWNNIKKYSEVEDAFFIFDEQKVIGYGSWAKSFLKIAKNNIWILLTATPGDTWMDYMSVFIANGFYKHKTDFITQHVIYNRNTKIKYPQITGYLNENKLEALRKKIVIQMNYETPFNLHHKDIKVDYNIDIFNRALKNHWNIFENKPVRNSTELFFVLRRIVNNDITRQRAVANLFNNIKRAIIFYNYNYELNILRDLFTKLEIPFSEWNGQKHETILQTKKWAYLVQFISGAEGWECIDTDTVIYFSENYSYKMMQQSSGRIIRRNTQFKDLYFYHLLSDSIIDNEIRKALIKKEKFNKSLFMEKLQHA